MNELFARRYAQSMSFHQLQRSLPLMWAATRLTKEKLDVHFVKEEIMRVNGQRTMPLLIGEAASFDCHASHLNQLTDNCSWAESSKAMTVRHQSPFTQRIAAVGRMNTTIATARTAATAQNAFGEQIARIDGLMKHESEPDDLQ
eukprot:GILI01028574.1.p1 GENE.GILI01028574.1~~GILI01028574.1.p1  ORF type:complete len:156 (-),score=16.88 GILI01028574.1:31-462(-)